MDPETELAAKLRKCEMMRKERALSLDFERKAAKATDPALKEQYNHLAAAHAQKARLLQQ